MKSNQCNNSTKEDFEGFKIAPIEQFNRLYEKEKEKDSRYKDADGTLTNPECGNSIGRSCSPGEVRSWPTGGSGNGNVIMCFSCAEHYGYDWEDGKRDFIEYERHTNIRTQSE